LSGTGPSLISPCVRQPDSRPTRNYRPHHQP
jgi:hypothetical protein